MMLQSAGSDHKRSNASS